VTRTFRAARRSTCALVLAAWAMSSSPARAQQPPAPAPQQPAQPQTVQPTGEPQQPQRPLTALFRGAQRQRRDVISLSSSFYGAYDQELGPTANGGGPRGLLNAGPYTGIDLGLGFSPTGEGAFAINARANSSIRYYPDLTDLVAATHDGSVSASYEVNDRLSFNGRGGFAYTPYFDFAALPDLDPESPAVPVRGRDTAFSTRRLRTFEGGGDLVYGSSERSSISLGYGIRQTTSIEEGQSATDLSAFAGYHRRLNRRTTSRITFVHRDGENEVGGVSRPVRVEDLEFGLDRDWARSQTRRTTFSFSVGPSLIEHQNQQQVRAFGGFGVSHPFARSWNIRAFYRRGVTFLTGVTEPMLSNSATVTVGGLLTRKLDVSLSAGATLGEVGIESETAQTYDTYTGSARARYAISRSFAIYGEYIYQSHNYNAALAPVVGEESALPGVTRSGLRFGLTWYTPLLQDTPRPEPARNRERRRR
jgi:hypothetical protein